MDPVSQPHTKTNGDLIDLSDSLYDSIGTAIESDESNTEKENGEEQDDGNRFDPFSLMGRTFISPPDNLGNTKRLQITDTIDGETAEAKKNLTLVRFKVKCKEE